MEEHTEGQAMYDVVTAERLPSRLNLFCYFVHSHASRALEFLRMYNQVLQVVLPSIQLVVKIFRASLNFLMR